MTVSTINSVAEFVTNGATINFPFYFKFLDSRDLLVTYIDPEDVSTVLVMGTQYTVSGAGNDKGGSVSTTTVLRGPGKLIVSRDMEAYQQTSLRNQGKFLAETHEDVFDRLTMLIQQGFAIFKRALTRPFGRDYFYAEGRRITDVANPVNPQDVVSKGYADTIAAEVAASSTSYTDRQILRTVRSAAGETLTQLPAAALRTNKVMGFDSAGNPIAIFPDSGSGTELAILLAGAEGSKEIGHGSTTVGIEINALASRRELYQDLLLNKINENRNWIYPWGGRGVVILGDSISHMAFSRDVYRNNWTNILKRCINAEFDTSSYGFVSLLATLGSGGTLSREIHAVIRTGSWAELTLDQCEWSVSGFALQSSVAASELIVNVPTFQRFFGVWYHSFSGGGAFEIYVNGVLKATINTNGSEGATRTSAQNIGALAMEDGGKGSCIITLKVISGTVRLIGISYENTDYDHQVSNFSQSGRRLRWVSQEVIQKVIRGSTSFLLCLGYNDNALAEADPAYLAAIKQRIDWIIAEATAHGVKVYVLDFVWIRGITRALPKELKRCADSIPGGTYVRFADYLKTNSGLADGPWLTDSIRLFEDSAHPNVLGHKMIAETVAKVMGLSVSSKRSALDYYDFWTPVQLTGVLRNTFTDPMQITAYKRQGTNLVFRAYFYNETVNNGTTPVPAGTYDLITSADLGADIYVPITTLFPLSWNASDGELITPYMSAFIEARFARGGFRIIVKTTTKRNIEGAAIVPVFKSEKQM